MSREIADKIKEIRERAYGPYVEIGSFDDLLTVLESAFSPARKAADPDAMACDCISWACVDMSAAMGGNGHNPACPKFVPNVR